MGSDGFSDRVRLFCHPVSSLSRLTSHHYALTVFGELFSAKVIDIGQQSKWRGTSRDEVGSVPLDSKCITLSLSLSLSLLLTYIFNI